MQQLIEKINKINKIGIPKNDVKGNAFKLYKKIDNIYKDKNHYITKANSYIRKKRNIDIDYEDNYLFSENDAQIMGKVIPEKMFNTYKNKFNDILKYKIETKKNLKKEKNLIKNESAVIANKYLYKKIQLRDAKMDKVILHIRTQKLRDKINNLKKSIKEIKEQIKKQDKILNEKEKENKRINDFYNKLTDKKNN